MKKKWIKDFLRNPWPLANSLGIQKIAVYVLKFVKIIIRSIIYMIKVAGLSIGCVIMMMVLIIIYNYIFYIIYSIIKI